MFLMSKGLIYNNISKSSYITTNKKSIKKSKRQIKCQSTSVALESEDKEDKEDKEIPIDTTSVSFRMACPICNTTVFKFAKAPKTKGNCTCEKCQRSFAFDEKYIDLTLTSGLPNIEYLNYQPASTSLFQNPIMGYVYERGWRQNFATFGFPGPDKEFESILDILKTKYGSIVMDLSCGSGLFTRRFATCNKFSGVIAVDFSDAMLTQTKQYLDRMNVNDKTCNVIEVKADVARMPFETSSIDAIHAGAALHCWPEAQRALAEIGRILKPDGVFVGTTIGLLNNQARLLAESEFSPINELFRIRNVFYNKSVKEIDDLLKLAGLQDINITQDRRYVFFSAKKPSSKN